MFRDRDLVMEELREMEDEFQLSGKYEFTSYLNALDRVSGVISMLS